MFIVLWHGIIDDLSNVQEEDAQENEQKIESERTNVKEAQDELKKHETMLMNINQKYADVKNKMEQLSDETDQLKVRESWTFSIQRNAQFKYFTFENIYIYRHSSRQKFLNRKIFNVFLWILFCSPTLHLFDPNNSKSSNIVKYFYYL